MKKLFLILLAILSFILLSSAVSAACSTEEFNCLGDGTECIPQNQTCDKIQQCSNGADEGLEACDYCDCYSDSNRCRNSAFGSYDRYQGLDCVDDCDLLNQLSCRKDSTNCPSSSAPYYNGVSCFADEWCRTGYSEECIHEYTPDLGYCNRWFDINLDAQVLKGESSCSINSDQGDNYLEIMQGQSQQKGIALEVDPNAEAITFCLPYNSNSGKINLYVTSPTNVHKGEFNCTNEINSLTKLDEKDATEADPCSNCIVFENLNLLEYANEGVVHLYILGSQNCGQSSSPILAYPYEFGTFDQCGDEIIDPNAVVPEFSSIGIAAIFVILLGVILFWALNKK